MDATDAMRVLREAITAAMLAKTNESPAIKSRMDDVAEAVAAVKRDLICELPKMRRTGKTDVSDLQVATNELTPVSEPLYAVASFCWWGAEVVGFACCPGMYRRQRSQLPAGYSTGSFCSGSKQPYPAWCSHVRSPARAALGLEQTPQSYRSSSARGTKNRQPDAQSG
jgi:hypothetical protein